MTNKMESKYLMVLAIISYLEKNATITNTLPNYSPLYTKMKANILQVEILRGMKETVTSGIPISKEQLKSDLIAMALDYSRKTEAYASINNNIILSKEVHYSKTDLKKSGNAKLKDRALIIYDRALANLPAMISYGVNEEGLAAYKLLIDQFTEELPNVRLGKSGQKQTSDQLIQLFKENDEILSKIDLLVEIVHTSQPVFYKGYKDLRKVIETGRSSLAAKGMVTDASNGEPLKGVRISFDLDGNKAMTTKSNGSIVKKSAEKGRFNVKTMAAGIYIVTASKIGYVTQVVKLVVNTGELSDLKVELVKD